MRHFSHTCNFPVVSYNISAGEYLADVDVAYKETLQKLAVAIEVPYLRIKNAISLMMSVTTIESDEFFPKDLTPSEWAVIRELLQFHAAVRRGMYWNERSAVFTYVNCNTGKSVVWVHVIA